MSYLTIFDVQGYPTTIPLDLINGSRLLIIGLDIKKYGDTRNMAKERFFVFK